MVLSVQFKLKTKSIMSNYDNFVDSVNDIIVNCTKHGILQLYTDQNDMEGSKISMDGKDFFNFGSCSYLGLEYDQRMQEASIDAINKYGTQYSSSRGYVSIGLYKELEKNLDKVFGGHCVISPTTTLGHISTIPLMVKDDDAVIFDHQVHNSVQTAITLLKPRGISVERIRHNNMEDLEKKINRLKGKCKRVWYMADGIYSMYGDACPTQDIERLLNKYKELHFYVDDAHGTSCFGKHGRGYVLDKMELHPKMIVAASLNKAFASGGGCIVFPNKEWAQKVRYCGGPMMFSGPLQPANLGAAIACSKIHLSDEIIKFQEDLQEKIRYTKEVIKELELPCISNSDAPIFYIGVSLPKIAYKTIEMMKAHGYFVNIGIFPAVSSKSTGVRFTITRNHSKVEIKSMLNTLKTCLDLALKQNDFNYEMIYKAFRMTPPKSKLKDPTISKNSGLKIERFKSIQQINKTEWDSMFLNKGLMNFNSQRLLEFSFSNNSKKENNWDFEYLIIRDKNNKPVVGTFLTVSWYKDDLMSPSEVSAKVEEARKLNPDYLCSEVLSVGTPVGEGEQIYINEDHLEWEVALGMLLDYVNKKQVKENINQIIVRDFSNPGERLEKVFNDYGFFKLQIENNNYIADFDWNNLAEFRTKLTKRSKRHFVADVISNLDKFEIRFNPSPSNEEIDHAYNLYEKVHENSLKINTFKLPKKLFIQMGENEDWTLIEIFPKSGHELDGYDGKAVCIGLCNINGKTANAILCGINYTYNREYRVYLQLLFSMVNWAKEQNANLLNLGYTADTEKKKVSAKQNEAYIFMQIQDDFNMKLLADSSNFEAAAPQLA